MTVNTRITERNLVNVFFNGMLFLQVVVMVTSFGTGYLARSSKAVVSGKTDNL